MNKVKGKCFRLGNWVKYRGYPMRIVSICADDWVGIDAGGAGCIEVGIKEIKPIPLKIKLVNKLGEENKYHICVGLFYRNNKIKFEYAYNELYIVSNINDDGFDFGKYIRYVHELQNLYQALFGEEIEIEEEWL